MYSEPLMHALSPKKCLDESFSILLTDNGTQSLTDLNIKSVRYIESRFLTPDETMANNSDEEFERK